MGFTNLVAGPMVALSLVFSSAAIGAEPARMGGMGSMADMGKMGKMGNMDEFMKSCDMDHDGMMSKAEMLAHMEKMFDRMDAKKTGKLDKTQTQEFVKQFTAPSGG